MARQTSLKALLASVLILVFGGCRGTSGSSSAAPPAPPEVGVATVLSRPARQWDEFNGRVSAIRTVTVRPRVSGYIENVAYKEGTEVEKGDLLFVIDPRAYRDALNNARAQLERARAAQEIARVQDQRAQALIAAKAISQEEVDNRRADLAQGNASVRAAEAAVATAQLNL